MKKIMMIVVIFISILLTGCQTTGNPTIDNFEQNIPDYTPASEDVIDTHGEIENIERFREFLINVNEGKAGNLRVVSYTEEGDPMLHDLEYDGEVIKTTKDTRRDGFGEGSIIHTTCTSIEVVETTERTDYLLEGCKNPIDNTVLVLWRK